MKNATIDNIELSTTHKLQALSSHQLNGAARLPLPNLNEIINSTTTTTDVSLSSKLFTTFIFVEDFNIEREFLMKHEYLVI